MQITLPDDSKLQAQALAAGFDSVEQYIQELLNRDAERVAVQQGIDDLQAGRVRSFEEFDAEFRSEKSLPPRS